MVVSIFLSGCVDITDSYKPGNFGATEEEAEMVDAMTEKYGDMTQEGNPRLLEVMMTSSITNFIPVDKVLKYSKDSDNLYVWFVYDNFDNDVLNIEWTYLNEDYLVHTFESETGEDFGRGSFILEKPDDGWPIGNYEVKIMGAGVSESVKFEIIDGPTESIPLDLSSENVDSINSGEDSSSETSTTTPGWYLVGAKDYDTAQKSTDPYTYELDFKRGDVTTSMSHRDGAVFAVRTTWEEPPAFIGSEEPMSIKVIAEGLRVETMGLQIAQVVSLKMDMPDVEIGGITAGAIRLGDPILGTAINCHSSNLVENKKLSGTFTANTPKKEIGDGRFGLTVTITGHAGTYGTRYNYEWRE
ncbi:hypothetical protein V7O67_05250 [Methanolobus sp. ZRKC4]|uniref:hypothetical protein n=1 Tax=Methanolobus sp. ZRKC4 TaxID=3125787 RepID=UPI0032465ABE